MKYSKRELNDYKCKSILEMFGGWFFIYIIFGLSLPTLIMTFTLIVCGISIAKI